MRNVGLNSWGAVVVALLALSLVAHAVGGIAGSLAAAALVVAALLSLFVSLMTALGWPGRKGAGDPRRGEDPMDESSPQEGRGRSGTTATVEDGRGAVRRDP